MDSNDYVQSLVLKSRIAQQEFEKFDQQQVNDIVKAIARYVYDNAVDLARMAVEETRMGVFEDKIKKNLGKSKVIWNSIKNKPSVGVIRRDAVTGIVEVAKPMGVVGAVTPCTNPIVTPMCNAMFALKCRNSIIIAPHPRARKCAKAVVDGFNEALKPFHAPENLIQVIEEPSVEMTSQLMKAVDVIIATGGMGMVKSAYSSGKPALGVGAGNVQCIIDHGYDPGTAIPKIVEGRAFDNGIICSGEQTIIVHEADYEAVKAALKANSVLIIQDAESKEKIRRAMFIDGVMNKNLVGQSAAKVAEVAGVALPENIKVLAVEADGIGEEDVLCQEKMCPVITLIKYQTFAEAIDIAITNLEVEGKGHSISIHSDNSDHLEYAANRVPVSRILVNQICATMNGGSFFNGFAATTTLGCGSWGNNSISENLDYKHLMNITRIGYFNKDAKVPTDAEMWG